MPFPIWGCFQVRLAIWRSRISFFRLDAARRSRARSHYRRMRSAFTSFHYSTLCRCGPCETLQKHAYCVRVCPASRQLLRLGADIMNVMQRGVGAFGCAPDQSVSSATIRMSLVRTPIMSSSHPAHISVQSNNEYRRNSNSTKASSDISGMACLCINPKPERSPRLSAT